MGMLYVVATPIGNLEDITVRAVKTLLMVETVACEDTRRTGLLLKLLRERYGGMLAATDWGRKQKLVSVRDWNEANMTGKIVELLKGGDVALVSDAGTPLVSDPGFKVVRAVKAAGYAVSPIPGPCAAMAALSAAGLPTDKFMFWGFLPKKFVLQPGMTHVIYESSARAEKTLRQIKGVYPEGTVMVAQEMTKIHESIMEWVEGMKLKGEVTILVYVGKA